MKTRLRLRLRLPRRLPVVGLLLSQLLSPAAGAAGQQLDMDGMSVIGNRELPKALFIVPWKDPEAGLTPERPVNSLIDEALQPVDPEVFRRKLDYFDTVHNSD
jgi:hypothetical protein